ncbi:MAG: hypothetical protein V4687_09675 [Bacteroidota bacterium]
MKYASESYAQNNKKEEIEVLGFAGIIFFCFVLVFAASMLILSFNPLLLVKGISTSEEMHIATNLLIILAVFSPVFVVQRIIQIIYGVRLRDYVFQRVLIISNIVKLLSAIFFFGNDQYLLTEYFLFSQICNLIAVIVGLYFINKNLDFDLLLLLKSFRFSKKLYNKTRKLAFTSVFLTICWIIYYELDAFVIGKTLGVSYVATYAIALSIAGYFRTLFGILFTPFIARFNHFIGLNDRDGLQIFLIRVFIIFFPATVFPIISISLTMKNFILTWVGANYSESIPIAGILVMSFVFSFINSPASILVMGYERIRALYFTSALQPVIYWGGIFFTFSTLGLQSFAYFKFFAFFLEAIVYLYIILGFLELSFSSFFKKIVLPGVLPVGIVIFLAIVFKGFLPLVHSKAYLILYFFSNGLIVLMAMLCYYFTSPVFKEFVNGIMSNFLGKYKPSI